MQEQDLAHHVQLEVIQDLEHHLALLVQLEHIAQPQVVQLAHLVQLEAMRVPLD